MGESGYHVRCKSPSDTEPDELESFQQLVVNAGEVSASGFAALIGKAAQLGFLYHDNRLVGTAAIKTPRQSYREKVFDKSGLAAQRESYPHELGWIYLHPDHRGGGRILQLLDRMMVDPQGIFATVRTTNIPMQKILQRYDFKRTGNAYPSSQSEGEEIAVYLNKPA